MKVKNPKYILLFIFLLTVTAIVIDLPRIPIRFNQFGMNIDQEVGGYKLDLFNGAITRDLEIKKGLDISGGVSVLLQADMSKIGESDRDEALRSLRDIIETRVNLLGISEANVQSSKYNNEYRVIVELAGVFDTQKALETIGQVAKLDFRIEDDKPIPDITPKEGESAPELDLTVNYTPTDISGADLRKASVEFSSAAGSVSSGAQIKLQLNTDGTKKFKELTEKNVGKRLAIFLDDNMLIAPTINTAITDGVAIITGSFPLDYAKQLVTQLNAGALPVPVSVLEQRTIGPTLGQESVVKNVAAGLIGLVIVILFMIFYYGRLGVFASVALIIYALLTLALYKFIPVVLTLPGLAGFILSIGMAVDANILIFERIREELKLKKPLSIALENGFTRAWSSIRDANITTLCTAFVLFNPFNWTFLPTSGLVRGFALTLAIGIFMSLFTGIYVTRNLIRVFYKPKLKSDPVKKEDK